ncbi:hypothetical protein WMF30_10745 [Sorangium sp. So ce134]
MSAPADVETQRFLSRDEVRQILDDVTRRKLGVPIERFECTYGSGAFDAHAVAHDVSAILDRIGGATR